MPDSQSAHRRRRVAFGLKARRQWIASEWRCRGAWLLFQDRPQCTADRPSQERPEENLSHGLLFGCKHPVACCSTLHDAHGRLAGVGVRVLVVTVVPANGADQPPPSSHAPTPAVSRP